MTDREKDMLALAIRLAEEEGQQIHVRVPRWEYRVMTTTTASGRTAVLVEMEEL